MALHEEARSFHNSLAPVFRFDGEHLFNKRKNDFLFSKRKDNLFELLIPDTITGTKLLRVTWQFDNEKPVANCNCADFSKNNACKHISAAAFYVSKQIKTRNSFAEPMQSVNYDLAFLFHFGNGYAGIKLKPVLWIERKSGTSVERFSGIHRLKRSILEALSQGEQWLIQQLENDTAAFASEIGFPAATVIDKNESTREKFSKFYFGLLKSIWLFLSKQPHLFALHLPLSFKQQHIEPVSVGDAKPIPDFAIFRKGDSMVVQLNFSLNGIQYNWKPVSQKNHFFIDIDNRYYLLNDYQDVGVLQRFSKGFLAFPIKDKIRTYNEVVIPLKKRYKVKLDPNLGLNFKEIEPEPFVLVAEYLNQYMMMIPHFSYDDQTVAYDDKREICGSANGESYFILRSPEKEKQFHEDLRALHPAFSKQLRQPFFYVPFDDVMKNHWFLKTIRKLQLNNVQVQGYENLKRFRYNTAKPKFKMNSSSGVDWFDLKINLAYDKVEVPLQDLKNAIVSAQKMVVLDDGSIGILPEEWLRQFESVFKMGEVKGKSLRIDKKYFNLLLDIDVHIKEEKLLNELKTKKETLLNLKSVEYVSLSSEIKAELRPYQQQGFQWLQSLDQFGWGGCLADDMGLGKTLQTIAFLQYIKEKYPSSCNLVVAPTSLIFNWEMELKKFAPSMRYLIYYGSYRNFSSDHLQQYDVVLTSYGTVRNDIEELRKYQFHYVVLDESQIIKNPEARTTKACQLLSAKNRLILSGTPIQNNTYDLFAQMNFANPGFLGNRNFFKKHFAEPIDKYESKEAVQKLKKMTEPFILRRTKEKVATDLPDKSEIILYCNMKPLQREVYEKYRTMYRSKLLHKIEEDGIGKSAFHILEGLTRLRQICNSPLLINDPLNNTNESAKLKELLREIKDNTGSHKVLIFSQFTQMLTLIKDELDDEEINYLYLDGQTPGTQRMELVNSFQNDETIKVFLISLKAGGVGLNLTAADYVYLVDPWWNPSAESQAIDRTHRIGQTRKVFAYKMICKDTIEEKILLLQETKKKLASDLISEESSFISGLSKEDVAYLFE